MDKPNWIYRLRSWLLAPVLRRIEVSVDQLQATSDGNRQLVIGYVGSAVRDLKQNPQVPVAGSSFELVSNTEFNNMVRNGSAMLVHTLRRRDQRICDLETEIARRVRSELDMQKEVFKLREQIHELFREKREAGKGPEDVGPARSSRKGSRKKAPPGDKKAS